MTMLTLFRRALGAALLFLPGHGCAYLFTTDMEMEATQGFAFANWSTGYGDFHLRPVPPGEGGLRRCAWLDRTARRKKKRKKKKK